MFKKILLGIALFFYSLTALPVQATLYSYYQERGEELPSVTQRASLAAYYNIIPYTGTAEQNNLLEANLRSVTIDEDRKLGAGYTPVTGYESRTTQYISAAATTIPVVSTLDKAGNQIVLSNISPSTTVRVYLNIEAGNPSNEEPVMCTGVTASSWTGCIRGLSFQGSSETGSTTIAKAHNAGSKVIITNVGQFYNQFVSVDGAQTVNGVKTFTSLPQVPTTQPGNPAEVVSYAVLASTTYNGTVDASTTVKGIVELATDAEFLAGTSNGATGAYLVPQNSSLFTHKAEHYNNAVPFGETISAYDVLYVSSTNGRYYKAKATDPTSVLDGVSAVAFEGGTAGQFNRALLPGSIVYGSTPLATGTIVYLSDSGTAASTPGTIRKVIGVSLYNNTWIFQPNSDNSIVTATPNRVPISTASGTLQRAWIPFKFGGDCSDGAFTSTNTAVSTNLGNSAVVIKNYSTVTITASGSAIFSNPNSAGTVLWWKVCGDATITSASSTAIDLRSLGGSGGAGAAAGTGTGGTNATVWIAGSVAGGGGGTAGGSGEDGGGGAGGSSATDLGANGSNGTGSGTGGTNGSTAYFNSNSAATIVCYTRPGAGGGGGGSGNNGALTGGNGGRGGGAFCLEVAGTLTLTGTINAAGAAGTAGASGGGRNAGGGGGGGGGSVDIKANIIGASSGTCTVSGGSGAGTPGTGGNGAAGFCRVATNTLW